MNTASEYGFGAVIAALPGFLVIRDALKTIPNPLVNEALSVTTLAGITGSASGGMSIALAAMANDFLAAANAAGISPEAALTTLWQRPAMAVDQGRWVLAALASSSPVSRSITGASCVR